MTERKWEWVREYCIQQGFIKSAEMADRIDRVLCYIYGEGDASRWEVFMEAKEKGRILSISPSDAYYRIMGNSEFCFACEHSKSCSSCKFARLVGNCSDEDSLFIEFEKLYFEESGVSK